MIARPPLVDFIQRTDVDVFVEPDRSEYVVELDISGGGRTPVREHRAYIDAATNGSPPFSGITRAAAIVPMPLTAISFDFVSLIGSTCLNHSTLTRSDNFTIFGQMLN